MKELTDAVAVVTGAAGGIGRATALALARAGCRLGLADISSAALAETADAVARISGHRTPSIHVCDVTDRGAVASLAQDVVTAHGRVDIVVNNAGVTMAGRFVNESVDDLEWMVDINIWGVINGCRAFVPYLVEQRRGHIVNMSSMVGLLGLPGNAGYALTKGAVRGFSESLRAELRSSHVGVTVVHPGAIDTDIIQSARGSGVAQLQKVQAMSPRLRRWLLTSPDTVANRIVNAVRRDRARVVVGPDARAVDVIARVLPSRSGLVARVTERFDDAPGSPN